MTFILRSQTTRCIAIRVVDKLNKVLLVIATYLLLLLRGQVLI